MTDDQFMVIAGLLTEIRDALVLPDVLPSDDCVHPDEKRVSLATLGDPIHWVCALCKYEYRELVRN